MLLGIFLFVAIIAQSIVDIFALIAEYFGLDFASLLVIAGSVLVVVNYLKATVPFSNWIKDDVVPFVVGALALIICGITMWGEWVQILISAALVTVLAIGGWASAKMIAHKVGTPASNKSGGQ